MNHKFNQLRIEITNYLSMLILIKISISNLTNLFRRFEALILFSHFTCQLKTPRFQLIHQTIKMASHPLWLLFTRYSRMSEDIYIVSSGVFTYRCELMLWYASNTDFAFHQFQREIRIVHKQAIPHLKSLTVDFLNPEDWGHGILIGLPRPLFMIN